MGSTERTTASCTGWSPPPPDLRATPAVNAGRQRSFCSAGGLSRCGRPGLTQARASSSRVPIGPCPQALGIRSAWRPPSRRPSRRRGGAALSRIHISPDGREVAELVGAALRPVRARADRVARRRQDRRWRPPSPRRTGWRWFRWCRWTASTAHAELVDEGPAGREGRCGHLRCEGYAALLATAASGGERCWRPRSTTAARPARRTPSRSRRGRVGGDRGQLPALDEPRWRPVRRECDAVWHLIPDESQRVERLVRRHMDVGRDDADARAVGGVGSTRPTPTSSKPLPGQADRVLDLTDWSGEVHVAPAGLPTDRVEGRHQR